MLIKYLSVQFAAAYAVVAALPVGASDGAFSLPGSTFQVMRQQMEALPGGLNNAANVDVQKMHFTYDLAQHTFNTWIGGSRRAVATIVEDERPTIEKQRSVTISGPIALAIVRAINQHSVSMLPASFQNREKQGQFLISGAFPYDHQNAVVFHEVFLSAASAVQTVNYRVLDDCVPRISYVVSFPSYRVKKVRLTGCGLF